MMRKHLRVALLGVAVVFAAAAMTVPGGNQAFAQVQFCADCHLGSDDDSLFFLPEKYR